MELAQKELDLTKVLHDVEVVPGKTVEPKAFGPFAGVMGVSRLLSGSTHRTTGTPAGEGLVRGKDREVANSG